MKKLKYILLIAFLCGTLGESNAQLLLSESFENDGPGCGTKAFLLGCFPDWINTHGSAGVKESSTTNPSFHGSQHVRMYVDNRLLCFQNPDRGEGIALNFPFIAGECYSLSYAIRGKAADAAWILTDGLVMNGDAVMTCNGNDIVPAIPSGSFIIPETNSPVNTDEWEYMNQITFTPSSNFDQLWFRASNLNATCDWTTEIFLDFLKIQVCCDSEIDCATTTDLTACPEEDDFGSIALECNALYNWDLPEGSTAIEITDGTQSLIVNASPGTYTVTVTDKLGCTKVENFIVVEDCCDTTTECVPPTNLTCKSGGHGSIAGLDWTPVPGAQGYIINMFPNDSSCGCEGIPGDPFSIQTGPPPHIFDVSYNFDCYSWNVSTVCEDGTVSEPSAGLCVGKFGCE